MKSDLFDMMKFHARRDITRLYKSMLETLNEMKESRDKARIDLESTIPEQYQIVLDVCFPFKDSEAAALRKKILDHGNEAIREMIALIEKYEIYFDKDVDRISQDEYNK